MCIYGFKNTYSLMKRRAAPLSLQPPKSYIFVVWLKRAWNYAYLACQIQNFLMQGGAAPLQPPPGGQPPGPRERLAQALGLLATLAINWVPMFKIFISLGEMYSFVTCKSLVIYIQLISWGNIAENCNRNWNFISLIWTTLWFQKSHKRESVLNN